MTVIRAERMPTIETERLILRPYTPEDAPAVYELVKEWDVASTTLNIPHPYEPGMADSWIRSHTISAAAGDGFTLALIERASGEIVGSIRSGFRRPTIAASWATGSAARTGAGATSPKPRPR